MQWRCKNKTYLADRESSSTDVAAGPDIEGPLDIAGHLGMGLAMMPLVANLQQLAIAKFYTRELSE